MVVAGARGTRRRTPVPESAAEPAGVLTVPQRPPRRGSPRAPTSRIEGRVNAVAARGGMEVRER